MSVSGQARGDAAPFLRWAGSKRWLVPILVELAPNEFGTYFEPFLGSGAAYFALARDRPAHLSDRVPNLINCYEQVRENGGLVAKIASAWGTDSDTYYDIRQRDYSSDAVHLAAQFIYLNKLCFNGLYRENRAGRFNVPYGRPKASNVVVDDAALSAVAASLSYQTTLSVCDFEVALKRCDAGDLVFLDPPYASGVRRETFTDYHSTLFGWDDQVRLAEVCRGLLDSGVALIATNLDHPKIRELYRGFKVEPLSRYSSMSGRAGSRGVSNEILITANVRTAP